MCDIGSIVKLCGKANAPGLKTKLRITNVGAVTAIPAVSTDPLLGHVVDTDMTMATTPTPGVFHEWDISTKDSNYVAEPQGDNGDYWLCTLTVFVDRMNPLYAHVMNGTKGGEYIVLFTDKTDESQRILGGVENGVSIKVGEQTNDKNGYPVVNLLTISKLNFSTYALYATMSVKSNDLLIIWYFFG